MKAEAVSTKQEAERTDTLIRDIPLENICESKTNPRSHFAESAMAELAANVKQHGVLQPVLLRPHPSGESGVYELVAGARRFRASKLARRERELRFTIFGVGNDCTYGVCRNCVAPHRACCRSKKMHFELVQQETARFLR
jgi:hypothetical protein